MRRIIILLIFIMLSALSSASFIRLSTSIAGEQIITQNETWMNVTVENTGDEPAYNMMFSLILPEGFNSQSIFAGTLEPNTPYNANFKLQIDGEVILGTYPLILKTEYADANGHPFSTLSPRIIIYKVPTPVKVYARIQNIKVPVDGAKDMSILIRNMDSTAHNMTVKLHLPNELTSGSDELIVELGAKNEKTIISRIRALGAIANSSYVITASVSFDEKGLKHSVLGAGMVNIVSTEIVKADDEGGSDFILIAFVIIFVLLISVYLILRRK